MITSFIQSNTLATMGFMIAHMACNIYLQHDKKTVKHAVESCLVITTGVGLMTYAAMKLPSR